MDLYTTGMFLSIIYRSIMSTEASIKGVFAALDTHHPVPSTPLLQDQVDIMCLFGLAEHQELVVICLSVSLSCLTKKDLDHFPI